MAYSQTTVSIEKSKEAIRKLLINFDVRGVQFSEDFTDHLINVKFAKDINGNLRTVSVTLQVPEPPQPKRNRTPRRRYLGNGRYSEPKTKIDRYEQMERATYRALHWWLKSQFEAVEFGLMTFEDVFLSHFEWVVNGKRTTVGSLVIPHLSNGSNFLPAPKNSGDVIEGDFTGFRVVD